MYNSDTQDELNELELSDSVYDFFKLNSYIHKSTDQQWDLIKAIIDQFNELVETMEINFDRIISEAEIEGTYSISGFGIISIYDDF